jgi:uncharacterized protein
VEWFIPGPTETIPFVGRRVGPGHVGEFFPVLAESQTARAFEPRDFIAQGDKVVGLRLSATDGQVHRPIIRRRLGHVFTVHNGKIAQFHEDHHTHAEAAAHKP